MDPAGFQLDIHEAIDGLYRTFADYKVKFPLDACPCCFKEFHQDQLSARPLRELPCDVIGYYAFKAILTVGTVDDFKHFLPRILELYTFERHFPVNPEIVFSRLPHASWRRWPDAEQRAIEEFVRSLWSHVLDSPDPAPFVGSCLGSIAQVMDDLSGFLDFWSFAMNGSFHARRRMADFLCEDFDLSREPPLGVFWERIPDLRSQVISWMRQSETADKVERAMNEWSRTAEGRGYAYMLPDYHAWRKRP